MTQQNAAMVEETTAAAHSLAPDTEELATLTGRFQLGTEPARPTRKDPPAHRKAAVAAATSRPTRAPTRKVVTQSRPMAGAQAAAEDWTEF